MSTPGKIRVLLVDYDAVTQAGIAAMLSSGSIAEVVGLAAGVEDFPQKFQTYPRK
jgi:chemotaxis response regulator CheB